MDDRSASERDDGSTGQVMRTWQRVERTPPLARGDVHVWRVRVEDAAELPPSLSAEECERAGRLRGPARARFIATRTALRAHLADYLGDAPGNVRFRYGATGKPQLAAEGELHFSVAHSGDVALIAVAEGAAVGVDLERVRHVSRRERVAARVLAPASAAALATLTAEEQDDAFVWAWTQREAYVKAIGGGVLRSEDPLPLVWPPRIVTAAGWSIIPLDAQSRHRACLVVEGVARPQLLELA